MNLPRRLAACVAAGVFAFFQVAASGIAGEGEAKAEIDKIERKMAADLLAGDAESFASVLQPGCQFVSPEGEVLGETLLLGLLRGGQLSYKSYEIEPLSIRILGDSAIVIGEARVGGTFGREPFKNHDRFTDVFCKVDGKWLLVSSHSSSLKESESAGD